MAKATVIQQENGKMNSYEFKLAIKKQKRAEKLGFKDPKNQEKMAEDRKKKARKSKVRMLNAIDAQDGFSLGRQH